MKPNRILKELKWFGIGFLLPFAVILGLDLFVTKSPLPARERLLRFEDICVYGWCILVPLCIYFLVTIMRMLFRRKTNP
ncbi:MAG: hypothetical protein ACRECJ_06925 [Limisphaerales bacterium]